jgi:hypothetical protein
VLQRRPRANEPSHHAGWLSGVFILFFIFPLHHHTHDRMTTLPQDPRAAPLWGCWLDGWMGKVALKTILGRWPQAGCWFARFLKMRYQRTACSRKSAGCCATAGLTAKLGDRILCWEVRTTVTCVFNASEPAKSWETTAQGPGSVPPDFSYLGCVGRPACYVRVGNSLKMRVGR